MATTVYTNNQYYADIATAIRSKNGSNTQYKPSEMAGAINALIVSGSAPRLQSKTVTPTTSQQTISYDSGYNGLSSVVINAISPVKAASDVTVSGATVSIPAGYYSSAVSKSVASGSAGTPTATKGSVSNNSISITPSVTNTTGYITGGTKTGTAVTVNASELVSGTLSITTNGTKNVANYASVDVNVPTGSSVTINNQNKTVTPSTSQQTVSADSGYTGLGTVTVNAIQTETKSATPSTSQQTITPSSGKYLTSVTVGAIQTETKTITPSTATQNATPTSGKYLSKVTVNPIPSNYIVPSGNKSITANGTGIDVTAYATVSVAVPTGGTNPILQSKEVTPTESIQVVTPDSGVDGLSQVSVGAISSTYIGSGITQRSSADLSPSGATITAPAGYYATAASKSVTTMTLPTAATASATSGYTSKATIGRSTSAQYINIPPGYNSAGGYYTISATPNMTLPTSAATSSSGTPKLTITPTTSNRYLNIPTGYNGTASYYTIAGDADLVAGNIKSGVEIFGVTGTYSGAGITLQQKTGVTPTTSSQTITADSGYDGLSSVQIDAISTQTKSVNPSTSSQDVTPDTGKYLTKVTVAAMPAMALPTAASASATSGYTSKATISRSTSDQYINIPTGYNSAGAYYKISAVANGSATNSGSASGSSATLTTGTNTITLTKSVSITPTVTAGYISSGTAGNVSVALTASVTTKAATTYNTSTSNQTIAAGTYLTGAQTILSVAHTATAAKIAAGQTITIGDSGSATRIANISGTFTSDATAAAADIVSGETAYVNGSKVTGSLVVNKYYTGSSAPASSLGSNGDIYIQQ